MNIRENIDVGKPDKIASLALLAQSAPQLVWTIMIASTLGFSAAIWWLWNWLNFIAMVLSLLLLVLAAWKIIDGKIRAIISIRRAKLVLSKEEAQVEALKIKNERERARADLERYVLPRLVETAIANGHNFNYTAKGDMQISDWKSNIHAINSPNGTQVQELGMPNIILPAKTEMIEVARRIQFDRNNIFLALSRQGDVTTTLERYLHCANDGNTGSGKTSNWRGQFVQFIQSGIDCLLLNPNFALVNKDGTDWRPLAKALEGQGPYALDLPRVVTRLENIGTVLEYMANVEVDRRFALMREGDFSYKPLYLFIDEWPEIALKCKNANEHLGTLLRRGRAVELCVSVNSQGFLKEDTDLKGSARENFETAFFLGGSTYSGAKLLDISQKSLEEMLTACNEPIGKGVALLRNNLAMPNPEIVRLPLADNEFLYYMLGRDDSYRLPPENILEIESTVVNDDLDRVYEACMQVKESGEKVTVDKVSNILPFSRGKVGNLMKSLKEQGIEIR
jgi:hypothetical protein